MTNPLYSVGDGVPSSAVEDLAEQLRTANATLSRVSTERDDLRARLTRANDVAGRFENQLSTMRQQHEAFREQVREVAIRVAGEQEWCDPGLNGVLRELGLPEKVVAFKVAIQVTAKQTVWVVVDATSEDEAYDAARELDTYSVEQEVDRSSWEVDEWDVDEDETAEPVTD